MTRAARTQVQTVIQLLERMLAASADPSLARKRREALALLHAAGDALESVQLLEAEAQADPLAG